MFFFTFIKKTLKNMHKNIKLIIIIIIIILLFI